MTSFLKIVFALILMPSLSYANDIEKSLNAFKSIQAANSWCIGDDIDTKTSISGIITAAATASMLSKGDLFGSIPTAREWRFFASFATDGWIKPPPKVNYRNLVRETLEHHKRLRKLGFVGAAISFGLLSISLALDSESFGELWVSLRREFTLDELFLESLADPLGDGTVLGSFINDPRAFSNSFLYLTPEQAKSFLEASPQLRELTQTYAHAIEPMLLVLQEPGQCERLQESLRSISLE